MTCSGLNADIAQEARSGVLHLTNEYGDRTVITIARLLTFCYDASYQISLPDAYELALGHTLMYAIGDKYHVKSLKDYALHEFSKVHSWTEEMFIDILTLTYDLTSTNDEDLKKQLLSAAKSHMAALLPTLFSEDCHEDLKADCQSLVVQHVSQLEESERSLQRYKEDNEHAWKVGSYQRTWNAVLAGEQNGRCATSQQNCDIMTNMKKLRISKW